MFPLKVVHVNSAPIVFSAYDKGVDVFVTVTVKSPHFSGELLPETLSYHMPTSLEAGIIIEVVMARRALALILAVEHKST